LPMHDLALQGTVIAVSADRGHHFSKAPQRAIRLVEGHGVEGDVHAGAFARHRYIARRRPRLPNLRQVHLIPSELFEALRIIGYDVRPGALGENITTAGLDLEQLPLRTRIRLGPTAAVELTGLRTPCALIDRFRAGLKRFLISSEKPGPPFRCGVMAVVKTDGRIAAGDPALVLLPEGTPTTLPSL
jgi:hypothetical protein